MRMIITDKRYGALRALGERRACFYEWRDQKAKEEREERKRRKQNAREQLKSLLETSDSISGKTTYKDVKRMFGSEEAWQDLEAVADRQSVIDEVVAERARKEREEQETEKKQAMEAYKALIQSCDWIVPGTAWRKVDAALQEYPESKALRKEHRLEAFVEYARELERKEEERREAEREQRRERDRQNRNDFVKLLEKKKAEGAFTTKTRWRSFERTIRDEPAYDAIASNREGSRPRELFEDAKEQLEAEVASYRDSVEAVVKQMSTLPDEFDRFAEHVQKECGIPSAHLKSLWEEAYAPWTEARAADEGDFEEDGREQQRGRKRKHSQGDEHEPEEDGESAGDTKARRVARRAGEAEENEEEGEITE